MARIFIHPNSVKAASGSSVDWSQLVKQGSKTFSQSTGIDSKYSNYIGYALDGQGDAIATDAINGAVDNLIENPVANAAVKTTIDIVKVVLMGQYEKGVDKKETTQAGKEIDNQSDAMKGLGDDSNNQAEEYSSNATQAIDGYNVQIQDSQVIITDAVTNQQIVKEEKTKENSEAAEQVKENQSQIDEKQAKMKTLADQIEQKKANLANGGGEAPPVENKPSAPVSEPSQPQKPAQAGGEGGGDGASGTATSPFQPSGDGNTATPAFQAMNNGGIQDPELQGLIDEYNKLGLDIQGLQSANQKMVSSIMDGNAQIYEVTDQTIQVSEEESANIDAAATEIVNTANNTQAAISEVKNLLAGQYPKLDEVTLIKLSGEMVKSAINGTESGLLASAAAAMGVGSVFSFGASASKAAELSAASADKASGAAARIATNAAGKITEQLAKSYVQDIIGQIPGIGQNLQQYTDMILANIQTANDALPEITTPDGSKANVTKPTITKPEGNQEGKKEEQPQNA